MSKINSRQKGKRGERAAAKFLQSLGIVARRGQQFSGGKDSPDVVTELENVHIEVKFGVQGMDLATVKLGEACTQAADECGGKKWCVLWKPPRSGWRLTYSGGYGPGVNLLTVYGDGAILSTLRGLDRELTKQEA